MNHHHQSSIDDYNNRPLIFRLAVSVAIWSDALSSALYGFCSIIYRMRRIAWNPLIQRLSCCVVPCAIQPRRRNWWQHEINGWCYGFRRGVGRFWYWNCFYCVCVLKKCTIVNTKVVYESKYLNIEYTNYYHFSLFYYLHFNRRKNIFTIHLNKYKYNGVQQKISRTLLNN